MKLESTLRADNFDRNYFKGVGIRNEVVGNLISFPLNIYHVYLSGIL